MFNIFELCRWNFTEFYAHSVPKKLKLLLTIFRHNLIVASTVV